MNPLDAILKPGRTTTRQSVGRAIANATYDVSVSRRGGDDPDCGIKVGDPVFVAMGMHRHDRNASDMPVFADAGKLLKQSPRTAGDITRAPPPRAGDPPRPPGAPPADKDAWFNASYYFLKPDDNTGLSEIRFVGFSETAFSPEDIGKRDHSIVVNSGGSLTVTCGEKEGLKIGERVCIAFPDETPENLKKVGYPLAVRSYDRHSEDYKLLRISPIGRVIHDPCSQAGQKTYISMDLQHAIPDKARSIFGKPEFLLGTP